MRYIKKSETEPRDLREYKKNCRKASPPLKITYKDMPKDGTRQQLARDQGYLCAYCMRRVSLDPADQLNGFFKSSGRVSRKSEFYGKCKKDLRCLPWNLGRRSADNALESAG